MDRLETRMGKLEARMDRLETRMDRLETRMDRLENAQDLIVRDIASLRKEVKEIHSILDDVVSNMVTQHEFKTLISQNELKYNAA